MRVTVVGADAFLLPFRGGRERLRRAPRKQETPNFPDKALPTQQLSVYLRLENDTIQVGSKNLPP